MTMMIMMIMMTMFEFGHMALRGGKVERQIKGVATKQPVS